jgi:quercetin dioxygenase-like cupin family protein
MKKKYLFINLFIVALVALLSACGSESQDGKETADKKEQKVSPINLFENNYSQVAKVTLKPGEELAEHEGEDRLIYALTDYTIDWYEQGQSLGEKSWKKGDAHVHKADKHSAKNIGSTQAEWIVFVSKTEELPDYEVKNLANDINAVAGNFAKQIFDDNQFRVSEVKLPVNEAIPSHDGINRIIYSLSDYTISYQTDNSETYEKLFKEGETHWHEAGKHALKNIGSTEAHFLVVSFK